MGRPRAKRIARKTVEDEEYELRHERTSRDRRGQGQGGHRAAAAPGAGGRRVSRTRIWTLPSVFAAIRRAAPSSSTAGVELVVLEATSDYWRSWFYLLEATG